MLEYIQLCNFERALGKMFALKFVAQTFEARNVLNIFLSF